MTTPVIRRHALSLAALGGISAAAVGDSAFGAAKPPAEPDTSEATLTAFGGKANDPKFDNTPALNAALASKITQLSGHFLLVPARSHAQSRSRALVQVRLN